MTDFERVKKEIGFVLKYYPEAGRDVVIRAITAEDDMVFTGRELRMLFELVKNTPASGNSTGA